MNAANQFKCVGLCVTRPVDFNQGLSESNRILMDLLGGADYLGPHRWPLAFNDDVKIKSTNNFRCLAKIKKDV